MEKVKIGDNVVIGEKEYVFGESSAKAFNNSLRLLEKGVAPDESIKIHLWANDSRRTGEFFSFSELKEALERAEKADCNKTPHGL